MTFYVNMGRAVDLSGALQRRFRARRQSEELVIKKSIIEKLGFWGVLRALFTNPKVGSSYPLILQRIVQEKHELGLHGGRNHGSWQTYALDWDIDRLKGEIAWGVQQMNDAELPSPDSFASPGWVSPSSLSSIRELGFSLLADMHDPELPAYIADDNALRTVNTNIIGTPGGVGWFESMDARGISYDQLLSIALERIEQHGTAMLYDHPCYMIGKIDLVRQFIVDLKSRGVEFLTAKSISKGSK